MFHLPRFSLQLLLLLLVIICAPDGSLTKVHHHRQGLTWISLHDLRRMSSLHHLKDAGGKLGAFVVTELDPDYADAINQLWMVAPKCLEDVQAAMFDMPDGSIRRTHATDDRQYPDCVSHLMAPIVSAFDQVELEVCGLLQRLAGGPLHFYNSSEDMVGTTELRHSPIKDHLHVYYSASVSGRRRSDFLVPYHTDNGLFLLLTPFPEQSLVVMSSDGQEIHTSHVRQNSILVLIGRALTDWLLQQDVTLKPQLHPVPHAVPALHNLALPRSVLARMKVAPDEAVPNVGSSLTFGEVFFQSDLASDTNQLCLGSDSDPFGKKRVRKSADAEVWRKVNKDSCSNGTAYCWMACLPLPSNCDPEELVCLNSQNKSCLIDNPPHDPTCKWLCKNRDPDPVDDLFCVGPGLDMLMDGFGIGGGPQKNCIILFFREWTLNTRIKFAFGCLGVFVMGVMIELIIAVRRRITSRKLLPPYLTRVVVVLFFGCNLTMGYLAMLVAMTYSVELFVSVLLGLIVGHGLFNSTAAVGESVDPCCASQNQAQERDRIPISRAISSSQAADNSSSYDETTQTRVDLNVDCPCDSGRK